MRPLRILSLGAGIQSSTILLMSLRGELPKLDHAIFADTGWEPQEVYTHLEWLKPLAEAGGIPLHVVKNPNGGMLEISVRGFVEGSESLGKRYATMPLRTLSPDGKEGMLRRQCTSEWKALPVERKIKEILGLKPRGRWPKELVVDQMYGISSDEIIRIRDSADKWRRNVYPLCNIPSEYLPTVYSRRSCVAWLEKHYPNQPMPRSACLGCPYHDNKTWRDLRDRRPEEWAHVVEIDKKIRHGHDMESEAFLHRSLKPLDEADLGDELDQGMFAGFKEECLGYCGS
tara:strand:- start:528 stop:1385 length:858 start_codon:yes stop_codon:yes gene_type:complete